MFSNPVSKILVALAVFAAALVSVSFASDSTSVFDADRYCDGDCCFVAACHRP